MTDRHMSLSFTILVIIGMIGGAIWSLMTSPQPDPEPVQTEQPYPAPIPPWATPPWVAYP